MISETSKKSITTVEPKSILCDICIGECKRGLSDKNPRTCTNLSIKSILLVFVASSTS